jgi:hypothetical protein
MIVGTTPMIAIPVAAFMGSVAMIVGQTPQIRCNDFGHDRPMIAIPTADDCGSLVRRETGKELMVQVHYDEGVATHIGPEPCAVVREDGGEASAGDRTGQPLSRESAIVLGADAVSEAEGHMSEHVSASARTTRRGRRPWHVRTLLAREPGDLGIGQGGMPSLVRIGKVRSRSR